jgi:hypothetical protein
MDHWTPDPGNVAPTAGLEQVGRQQVAKPGQPGDQNADGEAAFRG